MTKLKFHCRECKKEIDPEGDFRFYGMNRKKAICATCYPKFNECVNCGFLFKPEELQYDYCQKCILEAPRRIIRNYGHRVERDFEMRYGTLSEDTTENGKPKDEIFYGIELELESDPNSLPLDVLKVHNFIKEFAELKHDSSIKCGFEIVSTPATMEEHEHMWDVFFEKLPLTCRPLKTCGMHVHVSRSRLSDLQIGKILVFLHAKENREFIKLISGRSEPVYLGRDQRTRRSLGYAEPDPKKLTDIRVVVDRHTALNLNNENTIEFRIFWSTRDRRIFLKNIQFCKAMVKWCDWASNSIQEATNYRKFVDWVFENRKDYEYLALFLETPSVRKILE